MNKEKPTAMIDWNKVYKERRGKLLWLSRQEVLMTIVTTREDRFSVINVTLPQNWEVYDVYYDFRRGSFAFLIISPEFPPTVEHSEFPSFSEKEVVEYRTKRNYLKCGGKEK